MMRVIVMAAIKTVFLILFIKHIEAHMEYVMPNYELQQDEASQNCTLATPKVSFTEMGYTVDLKLDDFSYREGDTLLTGYSQEFHAFQYSGCNDLDKETPSKTFRNSGDIGMCYSTCETPYIGLGVENGNKMCFCYDTSPELQTKASCKVHCDGMKLCGGYDAISVYKYVGKNVKQTDEATCLAFDHNIFEHNEAMWLNCSKELRITCQDDAGIPNSKGWINTRVTWRAAVEKCLNNDEYPVTEENAWRKFGLIQERWTGQIRSKCLLADSPTPTGYLQRAGSNSTFILKFGIPEQLGRPLCVKNVPHPVTDVNAEFGNGITTDPRGSSDATCFVTQSVTDSEIIHSTAITPSADLHHGGKEKNGNGSGLDAVYITVPVLFLIAVSVIALLLLRKRKRKAQTAKRDTEGYRQVSFRNNQRTRTVTNQVYNAEGFHQAPSDSVQNNYHILEPTYEQVDICDQRNDQHSHGVSNNYHILETRYKQSCFVESPADLDGKTLSNVSHQLSPESACGLVNVEEQLNDRHLKEASRDYHILEPTFEQPNVVESHGNLNGNPSIRVKVDLQLAPGSSYEQVDVCAGAHTQSGQRIIQGSVRKIESVRNNVDPFDVYNHSSTSGVDDYDTTASVIGRRQTKFPITDDVYNRLGDGDTYNILKKY